MFCSIMFRLVLLYLASTSYTVSENPSGLLEFSIVATYGYPEVQYTFKSPVIMSMFQAGVTYSVDKCNEKLQSIGLKLKPVFALDSMTLPPPDVPIVIIESRDIAMLRLVNKHTGICPRDPKGGNESSVIAVLGNKEGSNGAVNAICDYFCVSGFLPAMESAYDAEENNPFVADLTRPNKNDLLHTNQQFSVLLSLMQELQIVTTIIYDQGFASAVEEIQTGYPTLPVVKKVPLCRSTCAPPCIDTIAEFFHRGYTDFGNRASEFSAYFFLATQSSYHDIAGVIHNIVNSTYLSSSTTKTLVVLPHGFIDKIDEFDFLTEYYDRFELWTIQATNFDDSISSFLQNLTYVEMVHREGYSQLQELMEYLCYKDPRIQGPCPNDSRLIDLSHHFYNTTGLILHQTDLLCRVLQEWQAEKCPGQEGICDNFWNQTGYIYDYVGAKLAEQQLNSIMNGLDYLLYRSNRNRKLWDAIGKISINKTVSGEQEFMHSSITWFDDAVMKKIRQWASVNPFRCKDDAQTSCPDTTLKVPFENESCCYTCQSCDRFMAPNNTMGKCTDCPLAHVFDPVSIACVKRIIPSFTWKKPEDIVLVLFTLTGLGLSIVSLGLACHKRSSSILRLSLPGHFFGTILLTAATSGCVLITIVVFSFVSDVLEGFCVLLWCYSCVSITLMGVLMLTKLNTYGPLVDFGIGGTMKKYPRKNIITAVLLMTMELIIMAGTASSSFHGSRLTILKKRFEPPSWGMDCTWLISPKNVKFALSLILPVVLQFCVVARASFFVWSHVGMRLINREILGVLICGVMQVGLGVVMLVFLYFGSSMFASLTEGEWRLIILLFYAVLAPLLGLLFLVVPQLAMIIISPGQAAVDPSSDHVISDIMSDKGQ